MIMPRNYSDHEPTEPTLVEVPREQPPKQPRRFSLLAVLLFLIGGFFAYGGITDFSAARYVLQQQAALTELLIGAVLIVGGAIVARK